MLMVANYQLIRVLKALDHDYVMIELSAAAVGNDIDRFADAGADLVMSKPLNSETLMEFLVRNLGWLLWC